MNKKLQVFKYVLADVLSAAIAWGLFFTYRKYSEDPTILNQLHVIFEDPKFWFGVISIPFYWEFLYIVIGIYRKIFRKSRLRELSQTITITFLGVMVLFFALILDDVITSYHAYYGWGSSRGANPRVHQ